MLCLGHAPVGQEGGHAAGRQLLKALYAAHVEDEMPEIVKLPGGKPCFASGGIHFSISHTPRHVFCALSESPIGIDAEEEDRSIDLRLARKILSPGELARWEASEDPRQALLRLWVLKEAAAKQTGEGIRGYPNKTDFSPHDPRLQTLHGCLVAVIE